jgi:hypothetical protein
MSEQKTHTSASDTAFLLVAIAPIVALAGYMLGAGVPMFLIWAARVGFVPAAALATAVITAVIVVPVLLFACTAQNCKGSDAIELLSNIGLLEAWEYTRSDTQLPPPGPEEVRLLAEPQPEITLHPRRVRKRWRSTYVYKLDSGDLWHNKMARFQSEALTEWQMAQAKQRCRDGQALRLKAKVASPWRDEL